MNTLQNRVQSVEDIVSRLSPLLKILNTRNSPDPQNLGNNCRHVASIAREPRKLAAVDKSATQRSRPSTARND